ncbi:zinc finger CCHC domain-containing protein 8 homolog [Planococcus citri]|uniref:zinc finger CCHC domain-containing protein 8 homolog n=1 Tax=Planococcus citri TaxID=170843 RepID=UPI0031F88575
MELDDSLHFSVDTTPTARNEIDVPRYSVKRKSTELQKLEDSAPKPKQFQGNSNNCWNCGRNTHSIRECDVQNNPYTLEWNREILMLKKAFHMKKYQKQSGRYHDTDKLSEQHNCYIPGPISHRLRQITGISGNDLPSYVYRLRTHGYPAAWLRYATVKPSGMNLYDKDGKEVADPNAEDGEILEEEDKIRYDLGKIVKFPGFNAPMPTDCADNYKLFNAPPYDPDQSVERMIADLKAKAVTEYALKKNSRKAAAVDENIASSTPLETPSASTSSEKLTSPVPSENLASTVSTPGVDISSNDASQDSLPESTNATPTGGKSSLGRILSSAEGTPLLRSKSGHTRLPPAENFSKDICDVINFENLPESTGKFERMRGLLKKVKKVLGLQKSNNS